MKSTQEDCEFPNQLSSRLSSFEYNTAAGQACRFTGTKEAVSNPPRCQKVYQKLESLGQSKKEREEESTSEKKKRWIPTRIQRKEKEKRVRHRRLLPVGG